jgi:predicted transcriptional regulator of viral defense system
MSISDKIMRRVRARGRGAVVTPLEFLDIDGVSRAAVDQALSRLARKNVLRRLTRGLYDYPRVSPRLGTLSPTPDAVVRALVKPFHGVAQVAGAQAANALGLSTQVPAHVVYLTNGRSCRRQIGKLTIDLRQASPKNLIAAGTMAGTVVQALRYLGHDAAPGMVDIVRQALASKDKAMLASEAPKATIWMRPLLDRIAHQANP